MLEDSITSSPPKSNRSIHKARLQRKIRRRHCVSQITENQSDGNECELKTGDGNTNQSQDQVAKLADLYWKDEPTFSSNMNKTFGVHPQKYGADFDPFEDELLLAVADRLDCEQARSECNLQKMQQRQFGQGFLKCSQLLPDVDNIKAEILEKPPPTKEASLQHYTNGPKTQFGVTESELLNFCVEAEEKEDKLEVKYTVDETPPPKRHKSIVESILDDFCSSPLSPCGDTPEQQYPSVRIVKSTPGQPLCDVDEDNTPAFHFKNRPLRTYGVRRSKTSVRTSIAHRLESVASVTVIKAADDDDDDASDILSNCSSGLSIQEDLTQLSESPKHSVEINKSQRVCENLQNLSAFFTQKSILDVSPTSPGTEIYRTSQAEASQKNEEEKDTKEQVNDTFDPFCAKVGKLMEQISPLRKEFKCFFSGARIYDEADFYGFPAASAEVDETLLQYDAQYDNTIVCPDVFLHNNDDDDGFAVVMFEDDICSNNSLVARVSNDRGIGCNTLSLKDSSHRDDELFSDSEDSEWHDDCDFFKYFKTQDVLRLRSPTSEATCKKPISSPKFNGFISASKKPIAISEEAKQIGARILAEVDDNLNRQFKAPKEESSCNITKFITHSENLQGFQTASKKQIKISDEAKKRAEAVLSNLPLIPVKTKENLQLQTPNRMCNHEQNDDIELDDIQLSEWLIDDGGGETAEAVHKTQPTFQGFQTASKKQINISEVAKKQAMKILSDLPDLPTNLTDENNEVTKLYNNEVPKISEDISKTDVNGGFLACTGFSTASRKSISISEEAKKRAAKIFETLPDFPKQREKLTKNSEEKLEEGVQLGDDWPLNNVAGHQNKTTTSRITMTTTMAITHRQKLENSAEFSIGEIPTPEQTTKILNIPSTKCDALRTPLASHFGNDTTATSTPLMQNLCLTSLTKSAIISRKNLLSLSKRKKIKYNQDKNMLELETLATPTASHVERMLTAPATPNVQEFFSAVPNSSTPRPNRARPEAALGANEIDVDFKKIEWNQSLQESSYLNNTRTPSSSKFDSSCENITVINANPSPKMRIARLHMYGKPPPVSPILMASTNNCRPSGLRRGRSMKQKE